MTVPELRTQARQASKSLAVARKNHERALKRIAVLQTKHPSLKEMVCDLSNGADVQRVCSAIVRAHQNGVFGGKPALWSLLRDMVLNANRVPTGRRYDEGTKVLMHMLFQHGGRRVVECLSSNFVGPTIDTLQRARRGMVDFRTGVREEQFKFISAVYSDAKQRAGILSVIPCTFAEDETTVKKAARWLQKYDILVGFCGAKVDHRCDPGLEVVVGDGVSGFCNINDAFCGNIVGQHARVVVVNPLIEGFPKLCVLASTTCNSFTAEFVRAQWDELLALWNTYCRDTVGPLIGHASDGDARRRKLFLADYVGTGCKATRFSLGWEGWALSYSLVSNNASSGGDPYGLHDSDFLHDGRKLVNPLDSPVRILKLGAFVATMGHLKQVYQKYEGMHGMNADDWKRTDRQNWASAQRLCSRQVRDCLHHLSSRLDCEKELCLGTEMYIQICGDYISIFLDICLTLRQRIVTASKVAFFLRLWRLWIKLGDTSVGGNTEKLTLENMVSQQTFYDIQMSCHFVVLLIVLFRDKFPNLPVPLHLTGSDACEQFFSKIGGMKGHERNYDFAELLAAAAHINRLAELGMVGFVASTGRSHKKFKNKWMKLHPLQLGEAAADLTDYSEICTNELVIKALKEGFSKAQDMCECLQMHPLTGSAAQKVWWDTPWVAEKDFDFQDCVRHEVDVDDADVEVHVSAEVPSVQASVADPPTNTEANEAEASLMLGNEVWDDQLDDEVRTGELDHTILSLIDEVDEATQTSGAKNKAVISPTVIFNNRVMYKSTLVSMYNGNPSLSKDRLQKVKQSFYFNSLTEKRRHRSSNEEPCLLDIGDDCGVMFRELVSNKDVGKRSKGTRSGTLSGSSSKRIRTEPREVVVWYIGRVQKIKKKYGAKWGFVREGVDLKDRPVNPNDSSPICMVELNYFTSYGARNKLQYDVCHPQPIDLDCIITTVTLKVDPKDPETFILDAADMKNLDQYVEGMNQAERS